MDAIGHLAGGIAHDFNNLLTAILGNLSLIEDSLPREDPNRDLLAAAERATTRAANLTAQLLSFARQAIMRFQPLDLRSTIDEVVRLLRRTIDPRIDLEIQTAEDLGTILADPAQMTQVLMNLCLNARDAMPEGGRLRLEAANVVLDKANTRLCLNARCGDFVRLRVSDTGHGIPAEVRPHIFEPFFTTKEAGKGTGLGLAMVFGIVTQHHGWIECTSEVGQGALFEVYLPRGGTASPLPISSPPAAEQVGGSETILLADDEPLIRNLGKAILEHYGYKVMLAVDGQEAVEIFQRAREQIDLVILDLTMPRLSGYDACHQLRRMDPGVYILFSSGYSADQVPVGEHERVFGFVSKPYRQSDMARLVRAALDHR